MQGRDRRQTFGDERKLTRSQEMKKLNQINEEKPENDAKKRADQS